MNLRAALKPGHPAFPGLVTLGLFLLWTVYWFVMAGRIEDGIHDWKDRQARHGTEVSWSDLDISGYPFRLVATIESPAIFAAEDPSALAFAGEEMRIITQAWNLRHIIIELLGTQHLEWIERPGDGDMEADAAAVDFTGSALRASMRLAGGKITSIDTEFRDLDAHFFGNGTYAFALEFPKRLRADAIDWHSRVRNEATEDGEHSVRDVLMRGETLRIGEDASTGEPLETLFVAFTETLGGKSRLHSGDVGGPLPPAPVETLAIHEAAFEWPDISFRLDGTLERHRSDNMDGRITLYLKGHEAAIRDRAEAGDLPEGMVVVAGAIFGILSMISETNEEGELVIPLDIKDGQVKFGFLPLFKVEDLR